MSLDGSIRYSAVVDKLGRVLTQRYRKGLQPIMTPDESERYALQATIRQATRTTWDKKLGRSLYSFTRYESLVRVAIPMAGGHLLLLSLDIETRNIDSMLLDKVVPRVNSFHSQGSDHGS